jgi:hypothetical protein
MSGGGFLLAIDERLFHRAAAALTDLGALQAVDDLGGDIVQYSDQEGRLFTLYEHVPAGTEWEVRDGPFEAAPGVNPPDMHTVVACPFECRWADLAVQLADAIARTAEAPTWVLDGDGVIWDAEAVDPLKVRL